MALLPDSDTIIEFYRDDRDDRDDGAKPDATHAPDGVKQILYSGVRVLSKKTPQFMESIASQSSIQRIIKPFSSLSFC